MSEGDEWVMRMQHPDYPSQPNISNPFSSEEDALEAMRDADAAHPAWTRTVHKLGPAIEPPGPREWVVSLANGGLVTTVLKTRAEAAEMAARHGGYALRVVPEDAP